MTASSFANPSQTIAELVAQRPQAAEVLRGFGIEPQGYEATLYESLRATCLVHQLPLEQVVKALSSV
jgi:hypothetical protein